VRLAEAQAFFDADLCCLDDLFTKRLRKLVHSPMDLFTECMQRFLTASFKYALAATTHSENAFAHMRKFLTSCHRPPAMATVATQHVTGEITRVHKKWKAAAKRVAPTDVATHHSRPMWTKSLRQRGRQHRRSRNLFEAWRRPLLVAERPRPAWQPKELYRREVLRTLCSEWVALSPADRRRWRRTAREQTAAARVRVDPLHDYIQRCRDGCQRVDASLPWGLADDAFPIAEETLAAVVQAYPKRPKGRQKRTTNGSFVRSRASAWQALHNTVVEPAGVVRNVDSLHVPCLARCSQCLSKISAQEAAYAAVLSDLRVLVAPTGVDTTSRFLMVYFYVAGGTGFAVRNLTHLKAPQFTGEFLRVTLKEPNKHNTSTTQAQNKHTTSTQQVHNKHTTSTQQVHNKYTTSTQQVHNKYTTSTHEHTTSTKTNTQP